MKSLIKKKTHTNDTLETDDVDCEYYGQGDEGENDKGDADNGDDDGAIIMLKMRTMIKMTMMMTMMQRYDSEHYDYGDDEKVQVVMIPVTMMMTMV